MSDTYSLFLQEASLLSGHGVVVAFTITIIILAVLGILSLRNLERSYLQEQQQLSILEKGILDSKENIGEIANKLDKSSLAYKQVQLSDVSRLTGNIQTASNITSPQQFIRQYGYISLVVQSLLLLITIFILGLMIAYNISPNNLLIPQSSIEEWRILATFAFVVAIILYLWMSALRSKLQSFFKQLNQHARITTKQLSVILSKIESVISQQKEAVSRMENSCEKVANRIEMLTNTLVKQHEEAHRSYLIITESQQKLVNSIEQIPEELTEIIDEHGNISHGLRDIVAEIGNIVTEIGNTAKSNEKSG